MKTTNNISVELHILQNFAPANLNRDDSNQPKDAEFGGYRRARISSQCIKRSIRKSDAFANRVVVSNRSKRIAFEIFQKYNEEIHADLQLFISQSLNVVTQISDSDNAQKIKSKIKEICKNNNQGLNESENIIDFNTDVLWYPDTAEIDYIKSLIDANYNTDLSLEDKLSNIHKEVKNYYKIKNKRTNAVDIAMFGRMLATRPNSNVDAAVQVAHAISTNKLDSEFDFFTAQDDLLQNGEQGAAMIGDLGFNSSCFYRYSLIDVNKLNKNLGDKKELAIQGVLGFIEGAVEAIPTGKQTSFAAQNRPEFIMAVVRQNSAPLSLANAFATPVKVSNNGNDNLIQKSVTALSDYYKRIKEMYGAANEKIYIASIHNTEIEGANTSSIQQLVENVSKELEAMLCGQEA